MSRSTYVPSMYRVYLIFQCLQTDEMYYVTIPLWSVGDFQMSIAEQACEDVSHLVICTYLIYGDNTRVNIAAEMMEFLVDVFGAWAVFWFFRHFNGTGVIFKNFAEYFWCMLVYFEIIAFQFF